MRNSMREDEGRRPQPLTAPAITVSVRSAHMAQAWALHTFRAMRAIAIVALSGCTSPAKPVPTCTTELDAQLAELHVPGLAAGIIKRGELACTSAAGMADVEAGRAATPDTLFCIASTSKTVTAVAVMQLVDDGKLALDDDVNDYLPYHVAIPTCAAEPITFRQLLTHTSSIADNPRLINCPLDCPYGSQPIEFVTRGADSPIAMASFTADYLTSGQTYYDSMRNFEAKTTASPQACPGTINDYSNMGIVLAAAAVESITGTSFEQVTHDRIFAPLGMTDSSWKLATIDPDRLAVPYNWSTATGYTPYGQYGEVDWPDGELRSSVTELASFLIAFTARGGNILATATVDEMMRPQIPDLDDTQGLVWFYTGFGPSSRHVLGHDGSDNGVSAYMFFDPLTGAGVILLSNGVWREAAANALMDTLFAEAAAI